ncbi:hypothetical protein FA95DRAFT_1679071 [Auriscalpium vulgare]|uniref:Uncharacterized protein n=1 Tax=Auriscalpium vulgare TaxID=40419 RepID=A0ACB8RTV1_9AGAM|nr:hypothetical protein FA95DRAFT_1679071 [Auriscalpium vulgare]
MSHVEPLKKARLTALAVCWALNVVAGSTGLYSLVRGNQAKSAFRREAPPGVTLQIDVTNIFHPGVVVTAVTTLISVLTSTFFQMTLFHTLFDRMFSRWVRGGVPLATRTLPAQAAVLALCALWLLPTQIAYNVVFSTEATHTKAFLEGVQLPAAVVTAAAEAEHVPMTYRDIGYLRTQAIIPWFSWLFAVIAVIVLFVASRRRAPTSPEPDVESAEVMDDDRKSFSSEKKVSVMVDEKVASPV